MDHLHVSRGVKVCSTCVFPQNSGSFKPENHLFAGQCSGTHHSHDRQCHLHGNPVTFVAGQATPPALMYTDSLGLEPKDLRPGCILWSEFLKFIYLLNFSLPQVCWLFSRCGEGLLSWLCGASRCRARGSGCTDSVPGAHGLCCLTARGIFLHRRPNPRLQHWQADSDPLSHQDSP